MGCLTSPFSLLMSFTTLCFFFSFSRSLNFFFSLSSLSRSFAFSLLECSVEAESEDFSRHTSALSCSSHRVSEYAASVNITPQTQPHTPSAAGVFYKCTASVDGYKSAFFTSSWLCGISIYISNLFSPLHAYCLYFPQRRFMACYCSYISVGDSPQTFPLNSARSTFKRKQCFQTLCSPVDVKKWSQWGPVGWRRKGQKTLKVKR